MSRLPQSGIHRANTFLALIIALSLMIAPLAPLMPASAYRRVHQPEATGPVELLGHATDRTGFQNWTPFAKDLASNLYHNLFAAQPAAADNKNLLGSSSFDNADSSRGLSGDMFHKTDTLAEASFTASPALVGNPASALMAPSMVNAALDIGMATGTNEQGGVPLNGWFWAGTSTPMTVRRNDFDNIYLTFQTCRWESPSNLFGTTTPAIINEFYRSTSFGYGAFEQLITGLQPGATYRYSVKAAGNVLNTGHPTCTNTSSAWGVNSNPIFEAKADGVVIGSYELIRQTPAITANFDFVADADGEVLLTLRTGNGATGTPSNGNNPQIQILAGSGQFSLLAPPPLDVSQNNLACVGASTGSLLVDPSTSLGIGPYSYSGASSGSGTASTSPFEILNLAAGSYSVTVTDTLGASATATGINLTTGSGSIFELLEVTTTNSTGGSNNGSIELTTAGGAAPYTFAWTGPSSGSQGSASGTTISSLSAGDYNLTITDNNSESIGPVTISVLDEDAGVTTCTSPVDVVILNDVSGSVDATEYSQSKDFFRDFVTALNIGPGANDSQAAIIEWSWQNNQLMRIPLTGNQATLQGYTNFSRPFVGGTEPLKAMRFGYDYLEVNGRGGSVPKILILATDALQSQVSNALVAQADIYKAAGYTIVTIAFDDAFSNGVTRNILERASTPGFSYGADAYANLTNDLAQRIVNLQVCPSQPGTSNTIYFDRDGAITIDSLTAVGACPTPTAAEVGFTIEALRQLSIPGGTSVTFYSGNPEQPGATKLKGWQIPCGIAAGTSASYTTTLPLTGSANVYAVLNDDGTMPTPISFPITSLEELVYLNNIDSALFSCVAPGTAALTAQKRALTPQPICGNTVLYDVSVCNASTTDASGVTVTDLFPAGFSLLSSVASLGTCATDNGGTYDIPGGCCLSILYEYDASAAANGTYDDQDVTLGGPVGPDYASFDGASTNAEDVVVSGSPLCPSDVVSLSKVVDSTSLCEDSFASYTFTIDNQTNTPLRNLSFRDLLPAGPTVWAMEPYSLSGISLGSTNITGNRDGSFTIPEVAANTTARFNMDIYLDDWIADGTLPNSATLGNLPGYVNGTGNDLSASAATISVSANADVAAGSDQSIIATQNVSLNGTLSAGTNPRWTTEGDGSFDDATSLTATYTPGASDILSGTVQLTLSADATAPVCLDAADIMRVTIAPNAAPSIIQPGTDPAAISIPENTTVITDVNSLDDVNSEGSGLTYGLSGVDADWMSIDGSGNLAFNSPPDFEIPQDAGSDNVYNVTVIVTDTGNLTDRVDIDVTVALVTYPLSVKLFLQGAYDPASGLMRDDIRAANLLPTLEPYTAMPSYSHVLIGGGETVTNPTAVFADNGPNSIVDWVFVELRDAAAPGTVVATRAGLLQRDGDVVEVDGVSPLLFRQVAAGSYYVGVRHRNHLGAMTKTAIALSQSDVAVDFSDTSVDFWESSPLFQAREQNNMGGNYVLWAGDADANQKVVFAGQNNDIDAIFNAVDQAPLNYFQLPTYILSGYYPTDINLDGKVIFAGQNNDLDVIFNTVTGHPGNPFRLLTYTIPQQMAQ